MNEFIIWVTVTALWCWGFSGLFDESNIFEKVGDWLSNNMHEELSKPLWACPGCMPSIHGTFWYWFSRPFEPSLNYFILWFLFIVTVSGFNKVIIKLYKSIKDEEED